MQSISRRLDGIARAERTTLITGPTGAGKDVIAQNLHQRSRRRSAPFVAVHCAALPETLVEAELFGHARGAFTGAVAAREGLVRTAEHGTLFLDEIDSLSCGSQAKLLRFLETGEFRQVGADKSERSSAWVVAATNQDLHARVRAGTFREDLLYRLEVVKVAVPPLRERPEDIPALVRHFLEELGCGRKRLSADAEAALVGHPWPGNVRELRHRIEAAALLGEGEVIELDELGLELEAQHPVIARATSLEGISALLSGTAAGGGGPSALATGVGEACGLESELWRLVADAGMSLAQATAMCEDMLVKAALRAEGDNRTRAAARLGINVRTIYKKLGR
ncbi:MAG: sigma-54-dependent Fis family transcriptional regulator [Myxococcales bacterium]|nr:sigma-54-dependent Fis family transcriptional regulator [Myxococcales bacterium]